MTNLASPTPIKTAQPTLDRASPAIWVQAAMTSEMGALSRGDGSGPAALALLQEVHEVMFPEWRTGRPQRTARFGR